MSDRFSVIGNRIYDLKQAAKLADVTSVDVLTWSGNNREVTPTLNFRQAMNSDTTKAIVIAHGRVIDGSDRLYKALKIGQKSIPAIVLSDEQAFSVMAIKTAVKKVHPDVASEIRRNHKNKAELSHPFYALETRPKGDKERSCRECGKAIDGDAIYFDRATGDEPWLREKGYLCLKHEKDTDVEQWTRCPRKDCGKSVPESEWSEHWRDHKVAATVHRHHTSKVAHCGQCEDDLEIEPPVKRRVNIDNTVTAEELSRTAGDVIGPDVFERKLRKRREVPSPEETKQILTETDDEFLDRIERNQEEADFHQMNGEMGNVALYDQDDEPTDGPYDQANEWVFKPGDGPQIDVDLETGEKKQWHPGVPTRRGRRAQVDPEMMNPGLPNPQFPQWKPRVDATRPDLNDPSQNPGIIEEVDELGADLAAFTGQKPNSPARIMRQPMSRASRDTHFHTVTDYEGKNFRLVSCGEHYGNNIRLAGSNKRDLARFEPLIDEWHDNTTLEHVLPEGYQVRKLNTVGDHIVEGTYMNHCTNGGTRILMGDEVTNPVTGEPFRMNPPVLPRDPDYPYTMSDIPRLMRDAGKPFYDEDAWRYSGPMFSLRTDDNLPKATFFHPANHETGEMNPLVALDVYGVNNKELHPKYRYRVYQYMRDRLDDDKTGADGVTIRWGKHYEGEPNPETPEELLTETEVLSRDELNAKLADLDKMYVRNETEKTKREKVAHRHAKHGHTFVDDSGKNFITVMCSFTRPEPIDRVDEDFDGWKMSYSSTIKEINLANELRDLYGDHTTVMHRFNNGSAIHRLNTVGDHIFEGELNRNCLRQYARHAIALGRVPNNMDFPYELSHFPYTIGQTDTDDPNEMQVNIEGDYYPWRYTGPFFSYRDENGISKATWFHPIDRETGEMNPLVAHDVYGINNSELHDHHKTKVYEYMLHNLQDAPDDSLVTIRWGLTNPNVTIRTPENEVTRTEILTRDGLEGRIKMFKTKFAPDTPPAPKMSYVNNFWGWKNGARNKRKYRPGSCECWEGYERVPGTKPCTPGSCRKKTGPVRDEEKEKKKSSAGVLPEHIREVMERGKRDQEVRNRLEQSGYDKDVAKEMEGIDADNLQWLKQYVDKNGLPGKSEVGDDGVASLWAMTQHAGPDDLDFMKKIHGIMSDKPEEYDPALIATMEDRINVYEGKPQNYGTQSFSEDGGKTFKVNEVADPEGLAERRKRVGLEDYDKESK